MKILLYKTFLLISLINVVVTYTFIWLKKDWNFTTPMYYNSFWAIHYSSIVTLIICLCTIKSSMFKSFGVILSCFISFFIFKLQFNPIDCYEYPHDVKILNETSKYKTVVRQRKSGKTDEIKTDTVMVIDKFIFRKRIDE